MSQQQPRTRFITHAGKQILFMDFSYVHDTPEALRVIAEARDIVARQPERSLRTLVYVAGSHFDSDVTQAMREFAAHNKPYVIASCVVGMTGLMRVVLAAVRTFTRRNIAAFESLEEAKQWLVTQS